MKSHSSRHRPLYWASRRTVWYFLRCKYNLQIAGVENIPWRGPVILAANHCSYLDPPIMSMVSPCRVVRFMARDTLFSNPVARWFFPRIGLIALDRTRGDLAALRTAVSLLKNGEVIGLFPEGTRSPDGTIQEAKGGVGFLMAKSRATIVPIRIFGTYDAFPRGSKTFHPARISARIGTPISPDELQAAIPEKGAYAAAANFVMSRIATLPSLDP